jgi:glycosyltransferase involved in cell wall biosynthesis
VVQETGFGIVAPPRDVVALTQGLRDLATAPPDRARGRARAKERYALGTVLDAYEELFTDVSAAATGR